MAEGFFPLGLPLASFEVGGVVVPGDEQSGTRYKEEVEHLLGNLKLEEQIISLKNTLSLGTFDELKQRAPALAAATISAENRCRQNQIEVKELFERRFTDDRVPISKTEFYRSLTALLNTKEDAADSYIIVTSIVAPIVIVKGCTSDRNRGEIEQAIGALVWGYRAGTPGIGGVGWNPSPVIMSNLDLFQLQKLSQRNNTFRVKPIYTVPAGLKIGHISYVDLNYRDPYTFEGYKWSGNAPLPGGLEFHTGTFYFRLVRSDGTTSTQAIVITLANKNEPLTIHFSSGTIR